MSCSATKMTSNKTCNGNQDSLLKKVRDTSNLLSYMDDDSKIPFISNSLKEIATLMYLASSKKDLSDISEKLTIQICSIVFNFKTKPYDSFLSLGDNVENPEFPNWAVLEFFQKMHSLIQNQDFVFGTIPGTLAGAAFMKRIMYEIFKEKRSDLEPLKILSLFCALSGLDIPLLMAADSCCDKIFKEIGAKPAINIVALNYILEGCCSCSQYFNLTTAPDELLAPSDWLEGLMFTLLDVRHEKNQSAWLQCFRSLLKMSLSVVEKHLTTIIKSTLLKINLNDADSKKDYCGLFIDLISIYSRLNQLPKFFVKLLLALTECIQEGSLGKHICNGQIFPVILKSVALHSQELPFGQILEQWKIFSETYTTFGNMIQVFAKGKGAVFFVSQLFGTFLMHCKLFDFTVPTATYEKFGDLILHTTKELKKNIDVLSDQNKEVLPLQRSLLLLCLALGEVKLTYNDCHEESLNNDLILRFPEHPCDCSLLLKFLNQEHCEIFDSWLKGEDKVLSFIVFELLVQKIRGLLHKKELSEDEKDHLKKSLSFILLHAKDNITYGDAWDTDLSTLCTKNYGCAIWRILLKYFPLIVNSVDNKELISICGCFRDVILQQQVSYHSSQVDLKASILSAVQSVYFQESKNFQIALIASVWKLDSVFNQKKRSHDEMDSEENLLSILSQLNTFRNKWTKYAESTPKCNQDEALNSLWCNTKDTCTLLNQILQSKSIIKPKLEAQVYNILQLIDCLPLEYLLPGNQVRCIIGLSVLLFLTPDSCRASDASIIAEKISKLLMAIFDGVRSIWFFDFVNSGLYLKELVNTLERLSVMKAIDETSEWPKLLLHSIIRLIVRQRDSLVAMEHFFSELNIAEEASEFSSLVLLQTLEQLSQVFKKAHLRDDYKECCENLASSLCSCCVKAVKKAEEGYSVSMYCTLIECYAEVIKILTSTTCNIESKKRERYLKPLPKIIKIAKENISNPKNDAYFKFFASVCEHNKEIKDFIPDDFHNIIWNIVHLLFQQQCSNANALLQDQKLAHHPIILKSNEVELLHSLFTLLSKEDTDKILEELFRQMENVDLDILNVFTLQMNLNIIMQVIDSDLKRPESSLPTTTLVNILSQLCRISLNGASETEFYIHMIKIPILQFINFLLKQKKGCIPRQHLIQSLAVCKVSKFLKASNSLSLFLKDFDAVFDVCYSLLVNHSEVVLNSTFCFLQTVILLLRSLIAAGSQDHFAVQEKAAQLQMIQAAQNMDRLFTVMSRHKENFSKLVPYLIAEYVDCVQHITLEAYVKEHLLSGMHRLLDLCSEDALKSVSVNINHSCRDIFSNVMKNYKQLKYRGDV